MKITTSTIITRRSFLKITAAGAATTSLAGRNIFAAEFPERPIQIYVPTAAGGGADRNFRSFTSVWKDHLPGEFEPSYYPGAAGRVGYETYMGKAGDDCHDLLFGNMGPEVLNWVVKKPSFPIDDYFYFLMVDADPGCIYISDKSSMKTLEDVIAEGKKRTLTVATSRLAHPASLGMLVLANKTGMKVNLIPLSGGKNTRNGVLTGEIELGVLPASSIMGHSGLNIIGLFDEVNAVPDKMPNAVLVNTAYDLGIPPLPAGARAFGIKKAAADKYSDRYQQLLDTGMQVFDDPAYKASVLEGNASWELIKAGGPETCKDYVDSITAVGTEYRDLLTG